MPTCNPCFYRRACDLPLKWWFLFCSIRVKVVLNSQCLNTTPPTMQPEICTRIAFWSIHELDAPRMRHGRCADATLLQQRVVDRSAVTYLQQETNPATKSLLPRIPQSRIGRLLQAFADQVVTEDGRENGRTRENDEPPEIDVFAGRAQDRAPTGVRLL